jgi:hypothetical protein
MSNNGFPSSSFVRTRQPNRLARRGPESKRGHFPRVSATDSATVWRTLRDILHAYQSRQWGGKQTIATAPHCVVMRETPDSRWQLVAACPTLAGATLRVRSFANPRSMALYSVVPFTVLHTLFPRIVTPAN